MIGVYRIKNLINKKCYYGSSKNVEKRWKTHKNQLNKKIHVNSILQRAWDKYGKDNFIFEIVEECELEDLFNIEQKYIDNGGEYNIGLKASGGDNISKNPNRSNIIENIKKGNKKWLDSLSKDEKKERFSKPMENNSNWKGGTSYVYCKCGKRIGQGHTNCIKCRPISGEKNPFFGKHHSDEYKQSASKRQMGIYNGKQNLPIIIDGVDYRSYGEASKILNIPLTTIRWRVKSSNEKFKNYKYKNK